MTSLNHYLDMNWLREAYRRVRKNNAPGEDGQTVEEYGGRLDENLADRLERAKSGRYVAPPVRRVHIPKGTGNGKALTRFGEEVKRAWRYWLNRRSGHHAMPWERFNALVNRFYVLPPARVIHSALAAKP